MSLVSIYAPNAEDFSSNGLCLLLPTECTVSETENGMYELKLVHPITDDLRWAQIRNGCIIKASVPMRESPLYELESMGGTETVTRKLYEVDVRTRLMLRAKPTTSSKILGRYKDGTQVVRLNDEGNGWYKVSIVKGGATGYMYAQYLDYVKDITETIVPEKPASRDGVTVLPAREQLFRINGVEVDTEQHTVTATAMHIFYDLRGNLVARDEDMQNADANQTARMLFDDALIPHDFTLMSALEGKVTGEYGYRGIVECLMYPDEGILSQTGGIIVRDNYDVFLLPKQVRDMGVTIRRGKNLIGVQVTTDSSDVVTRIIPVGKNKKGEDLYLEGTRYVDSPNIDAYPTIYVKRIEYDVRVGNDEGEFSTEKKAREELQRLAEADFAAGADAAAYGMEVDFITLDDTPDYADYASLQAVHIHDTVTVIDELIHLKAKLRVTGYTWDVLASRYVSVVLGDVVGMEQVTYGYTLQDSSVSGGKIIPGSVSGSVLRNATIGYAKIALAAIEQLNADSINALIARFGEITAGNITTDVLYAAMAEIITLRVKQITAETITTDELYAALADVILLRAQQITAGNIETDKLAAQYAEIITLLVRNIKAENIEADRLGAALADFVTMHAGTGEFDFATIQNLVAKALSLQQGSMDTVYIKNLAVTQANILSATLGKLVIKGDDGKYYRVFVGADGTISTEEVGLSVDEVQNGETAGGQQIVETSMNVGSLNATNLQANSAVINQILTTALSAEKITAADALIASATIPALYVTAVQAIGGSIDFGANESIRLLVAKKNATFFKNETPTEYVSGDTWIKPDDGTWWIARGMTGKNMPEITSDEKFDLLARFGEDAEDYQLMIDDDGYLRVNYGTGEIDEDGYLHSSTQWESLKPSELHTSFIDIAQDKLNIGSGGNVNINAGGELNVNAGAAHFRTAEYSLSILAEDGSEDTIMDFDADGKVLRVSEIEAGNMRPYIAGTTRVTSGEAGGLDGLKNMLERAQYEHIIYTQNAHDVSDEAIEIDCCDSLQVDIIADTQTRVPPIIFRRVTSNFLLYNLQWIASGQTALWMDSGDFVIENCSAEAAIGIRASRNARVVWLGTDENMETAGACDTAIIATEGADARLFGLIPGGQLTESLAGTIKAVNTRVGGNAAGETGKTITIDAEYGYYGTENGWNEDMLYQGYTEGKGRIYGSLKFALPSDVHVITTAVLTLKRDSNAGRGSAADVHIYGSDTAFGARPALGDLYAERNSAISPGASASFDVTLAAQALLSGDIAQLVLYTGESTTATGKVYSRQYARFTKATLKITY